MVAFFLCIWTKTQVGPKLRFSPKLRYFSRNSGSKIGKLRYSETNHLKFSVFKRKNASTERFYVLTAGKNCRCLYKKKLSKFFQNSGPFLLKTQVTSLQNSGPMNKKLRSEFQKLRYSETKCLFLFAKSAQKKAWHNALRPILNNQPRRVTIN